MANTYSQVYIQIVFAVQNRSTLIKEFYRDELYKYITGIVKNNGHLLMAINGMSDHIHILIGLLPNQSISSLVQDIKGSSSKWINQQKFLPTRFSWQQGYGVFSYSRSGIENVIKYINNQKFHHRKKRFRDEYLELLKEFDISYDDRYIFKSTE